MRSQINFGKSVADFTPSPMPYRDANSSVIDMDFNGLNSVIKSHSDRIAALSSSLLSTSQTIFSGIPLPANPSANVGLSSVNGTALTYMRSDSAPALSQAIAPTWTGIHTWSAASDVTSTVIKGYASQSLPLTKWMSSASALLASIGFNGRLYTAENLQVLDTFGIVSKLTPTGCSTGLTYVTDAPTAFNSTLFTNTGGGYENVVVKNSPAEYGTTTNATANSALSQVARMYTAPLAFTSFKCNLHAAAAARTTGIGWSIPNNSGNNIDFASGPKISLDYITNAQLYRIIVYASNGSTVLYQSSDTGLLSDITGTASVTATVTVTRPSASSGVFNVYINNVLVVSAYDSTVSGSRVVTLNAEWNSDTYGGGNYDSGGNNTGKASICINNFEIVGTGFSSSCDTDGTDAFLIQRSGYDFIVGSSSWTNGTYVSGASGAHTFKADTTTILAMTASAVTVSPIATFTLAPVFSSGTASQTVELTAGKALTTVAFTGTGNYVKSASPTLTGTVSAASMTLSGTIGVTGVATFTAQPILSSLTASRAVFTDGSNGLVSNALTGTGNVVMSASPTLTGTITAASANFSGTVTFGVYTGQSSIVTLGTIVTGVWNGTTIVVANGGTGVATLASKGVLYGNGTSAIQALAVNSTATNKFLTQSSSNSPAWATISASDLPSSFSGLANPSASIGLTAVNGSATTAIRSDGAPALSQAIVPTWSGVHTFTLQPIFSSLTASQAVFTDGSKGIVSNAITGSGNVVMSASPTLTGTISAAAMTLSSTLGITGIATFTAAPVFSSTTASTALAVDASKGLISVTITGTGNTVYSASPTLTGTITAAAMTLSSTLAVTGTSQFTGDVGIGAAPTSDVGMSIYSSALTGNRSYGALYQPTFQSNTTVRGNVVYSQLATAAASFTMATGCGVLIDTPVLGASSIVTTVVGLDIATQTGGGTNYAIRTGASGAVQLGVLTASQAVFTDASKNLVSNAITGSGSVVMSASPTLTGTIAGAAMTLSSTLAVTGTSLFTGNIGIGGAGSSDVGMSIYSAALTATASYGALYQPTFQSNSTSQGNVVYVGLLTANSSFTMTTGRGIFIDTPSKGASSTITTVIGLDIATQTGGGTNYAIRTGASGAVQLGVLTASQAVFTDASKNLVSNAITGSGNVVMSAAPTLSGTVTINGDLKLGTAGNGLYVKEGSNATMGIATLVLGTATVSTTKVTASSRIFLSTESLGTITSPVAVSVTGRAAGTSFTITSANLTDTSVVAWVILEPA